MQDGLPAVEDVPGHLVDVGAEAVLDVLAGLLEVFHLELDGGHLAAVAEGEQVLAGRVVGDGAECGDGHVDGEVDGEEAVFDHGEDEGGGAELEVGGELGHVGVADDDVEAAVFLGVGVGFVAGVDDGAFEGGLEADFDFEEVGALADLEAVAAAVDADADAAAPQTTWRETKKGVRWRTMSAKGVSRRMR